jgi:hypothetical protein
VSCIVLKLASAAAGVLVGGLFKVRTKHGGCIIEL